ncbi:MAG: divisome protein SepX/GlpR [Haloechinothrix sp.]
MPSSLIIVALAAAWLVVLVPMVARKRQEIARTGEDALAARVVRSGSARDEEREESSMSESAEESGRVEIDDEFDPEPELDDERAEFAETVDDRPERYRPGRGGFDPEAAEIAARAKYAFRQRVVVTLLATVLITALLAGFVAADLWWVTGAAAAGLAGYLGYLRRQVRIENEIRQRRLARMRGARAAARRRRLADDVETEHEHEADYDDRDYGYERIEAERRVIAGVERKPRPHARTPRRNTVVVDIDDEDPAFHELGEPGPPAYRRAVGE